MPALLSEWVLGDRNLPIQQRIHSLRPPYHCYGAVRPFASASLSSSLS